MAYKDFYVKVCIIVSRIRYHTAVKFMNDRDGMVA